MLIVDEFNSIKYTAYFYLYSNILCFAWTDCFCFMFRFISQTYNVDRYERRVNLLAWDDVCKYLQSQHTEDIWKLKNFLNFYWNFRLFISTFFALLNDWKWSRVSFTQPLTNLFTVVMHCVISRHVLDFWYDFTHVSICCTRLLQCKSQRQLRKKSCRYNKRWTVSTIRLTTMDWAWL